MARPSIKLFDQMTADRSVTYLTRCAAVALGFAILSIAGSWRAPVAEPAAQLAQQGRNGELIREQVLIPRAIGWALEGVARPGLIGPVKFASRKARPAADRDVSAARMRVTGLIVANLERSPNDGDKRRMMGTITHQSRLGFRARNTFAVRYRVKGSGYVVLSSIVRPLYVTRSKPVFAIVEARKVQGRILAGTYEPHQLLSFLQANAVKPNRRDAAPKDYYVFAIFMDRLQPGHRVTFVVADRHGGKLVRSDSTLIVRARGAWRAMAVRRRFAMGAGKRLFFKAVILNRNGNPLIAGIFSNQGATRVGGKR